MKTQFGAIAPTTRLRLCLGAAVIAVMSLAVQAQSPFPATDPFETDADTFVPTNPVSPFVAPNYPGDVPGVPFDFDDIRSGWVGLIEELPASSPAPFHLVPANGGANLAIVYPDVNNSYQAGYRNAPAGFIGYSDNFPGAGNSWGWQTDIFALSTTFVPPGGAATGGAAAPNGVDFFWWTNAANTHGLSNVYLTESGFEITPAATVWRFTTTTGGQPFIDLPTGVWYHLEVEFDRSGPTVMAIHTVWNANRTAILYTHTIPAPGAPASALLGGPRYTWFAPWSNTGPDRLYVDNVGTFGAVGGPAPAPQDRVSATEKGSVLIYSKVELRYTAAGALIQDTFIDIANDFPADVRVKMYFINGDMRIVTGGVLVEPGWNVVNNVITLTANEPTYWSAATGLPKGVSPFTVLDPGALPGRPDPDVPGERMLRGYIVAFAIDSLTGCEIRWNHLKGDACIVRYDQNSAWEYNAWAFASVDPTIGNGDGSGTCGALNFDGVEFAPAHDMMLMDFYAVGSAAFSIPGNLVTIQTDLTLHPLSADFRQETTGLVQTKASFDIWNQNEVKFSGTDRCIRCWDQTLLANYSFGLFGTGGNFPPPNNFLLVNLQSDKGRARINGLASANVCPPSAALGFPNPSTIDPLLGVVAKQLTFNGATFAIAGTNLHGVGSQTDGVILYDPVAPPPPENSDTNWLDSIDKEINSATSAPRKR